jgi:hypothetical protein
MKTDLLYARKQLVAHFLDRIPASRFMQSNESYLYL